MGNIKRRDVQVEIESHLDFDGMSLALLKIWVDSRIAEFGDNCRIDEEWNNHSDSYVHSLVRMEPESDASYKRRQKLHDVELLKSEKLEKETELRDREELARLKAKYE